MPDAVVRRVKGLTARLISASLFGVLLGAAPLSAPPTYPVVSTLSGNGRPGFVDGSSSEATFTMPMGLAYGPDGSLYVADPAAQRIRVISPDGAVRTLAGGGQEHALWVAGGYVDGDVSRARFDEPSAVAVAKDGTVYIADTGNHCIRKIVGRRVSTFAGMPAEPGGDYGAPAATRFDEPIALALDRAGALYVVDHRWGVRVIRPDGTSAPFGNYQFPLGIAVADGVHGTTVFVSDNSGIDVVPPAAQPDARRHFHVGDASVAGDPGIERITQGGRPIGHPFGLAALDDHSLVYTDPVSNTVRYLSTYLGTERVLGGFPTESAANEGATFADGTGTAARFDAPTGIAALAGSVVVADTGNRRIRAFAQFDHRVPVMPSDQGVPDFGPAAAYRIIYAGNSYVYWDTAWSDSFEGLVEDALRARGFASAQGGVRLYPVWSGHHLDATAQYLENAADLYQTAIVQINAANLVETFGIPASELTARSAEWEPKLVTLLASLDRKLRASGAHLLVVLQPTGADVSPAEDLATTLQFGRLAPPGAVIEQPLLRAAAAAHVRTLDLWPAFERAERSPETRALFMDDLHFTVYGRAVVADALTAELAAWEPWR
jgi:hypothetical protein